MNNPMTAPRKLTFRSRIDNPVAPQVYILIGPPTAFQPECPAFMYFASKPASRSLIVVPHPT
jgi:hypothetical protein